MNLLHLLLLLAPLANSSTIPAAPQAALVPLDSPAHRVKVPGDNPAFFSREQAADQLFEIQDLTISPNPPIVWHHIFFDLVGDTATRNVPSLANATLQLWA
ncbi:hypothetical protein BDV95DRAFT_568830 [Massariosphaeria phaeospora]|uniref:Tyrosinase copper-binding domain-containing protein n=1 Tax=Massariosphaeria phaeospora TaxID=100035 RepID=A0A7C8MC07_9PLEO|nr:hypothetical protein BDV95DRAFT_568830 [Massariosphaeria phaeospora]